MVSSSRQRGWWSFLLGLAMTAPMMAQTPVSPPKTQPERPTEGGAGEGDRSKPPSEQEQEARESTLDSRIRELEDAIWQELLGLERRIQLLRERTRPDAESERNRSTPRPEKPPSEAKAPRRVEPVDEVSLEERHKKLLKRQDELVARWTELEKARTRAPANDEEVERKRARQAEQTERELKGVLRELLDLRESSRERQIARLRAELDSLERSLGARSSREDRDAAVEARLKDLLGPKDRPPAGEK